MQGFVGSSSAASATPQGDNVQARTPLLRSVSPIFLLPTHLGTEQLQEIETTLQNQAALLTRHISEASLLLGAVQTTRRAKFELNTRNVEAEILDLSGDNKAAVALANHEVVLGKRKRTDNEPLDPENRSLIEDPHANPPNVLRIIKLDWLHDSVKRGEVLGLRNYLVCAVKLAEPRWSQSHASLKLSGPLHQADGPRSLLVDSLKGKGPDEKHGGRKFGQQSKSRALTRPTLVRETTAEYDEAQQVKLPPTPDWIRHGKAYACERITLDDSPNHEFLDLLEKIRLNRILIEDQIGVRAYSTSIASLAAYPYKFTSSREIARLPGCDQKIEALFREYQSTGQIKASMAVEDDPALRVIGEFYKIWGIGAKTAREWYFDRGWRDYDDIIEYGWSDLSRVQQIGLKYFDEFELKIPRDEVESIAMVVHEHANALTDNDMTCTIVGGYRRGKQESGDVDIILSHPDESKTYLLIRDLIVALERSGWVTHTLTLRETNSQRDQEPLGLRVDGSRGGFDTLDKALLVWQDPVWPEMAEARAADAEAKNPNVHRRVDIIISPWRTIGCAVTGWSSGTTFQRDLRRYAKHKHGWKFDSSGVRDRKTGRWIDLELWSDPKTRAKSPLEAEKRVFEGLGLEYRDPTERCTR